MGEMIDRDEEHLRLLKICYYILAAINGFVVLFPLLFMGVGTLIASGSIPMTGDSAPPVDPRTMGMILLGVGAVIFTLGLSGTLLTFLTARSLRDHRRRTLCLVVAGLNCLYIPWGTAIGICTIIVLNRPTTRALFGEQPPPQPILNAPQV
jgi:hypothetical protein